MGSPNGYSLRGFSLPDYPFKAIEPKWQAYWAEHATFRTPNPGDPGFDPKKPKIYILDMFPYPKLFF